SELETNEELKGEIKRLREMVAALASTLQRLSRAAGEATPNLIPYRAADFVEDLRAQIEHDFPRDSSEIRWEGQPGDAMLNVDPQFLQEAFTELFANALRHDRGKGPIAVKTKTDDNEFLITLHEPKARFVLPTQEWRREP